MKRPTFRTLGDENDKLALGIAFVLGITLILVLKLYIPHSRNICSTSYCFLYLHCKSELVFL